MLAEAGSRIGIDVHPMSIEKMSTLPADAIITAEREHWTLNPFIESVINHPGWLNAQAFECIPDRRKQKWL